MTNPNVQILVNEGLTEEQIEVKIKYLESLTEGQFFNTNMPYYVNKRTTLNDFIGLVKQAIDKDQENKKNKIIFIDDHSKTNIFENPHKPGEDVRAVVGYSLIKRAPGTTAGTNQPFDTSRREIKPQYRGFEKNEADKPGEITFYTGQWFDNLICFHVYARSNKEANDVADWFEEVMELNRQFFAWNGFLKYHFHERESDAVVKEGDNAIHLRPMVYWVRTEKCYEITEQAINNMVILLTTI